MYDMKASLDLVSASVLAAESRNRVVQARINTKWRGANSTYIVLILNCCIANHFENDTSQ